MTYKLAAISNKLHEAPSHHLSTASRYALYALLIFTPLARGSVQGWAVTTIQIVTLIALSAFLIEKCLTGTWEWIKTPLDKPILALLFLCLISSFFSMHHQTSLWAMVILINYVVIFYLVIHTVRTRSQLRQLVYLIIGVATFLAVFGLFKRFGTNPFPWWDYGDIKYIPDALSSTFGNRNHLAGYMEMALPLALGLFLLGYRAGKVLILSYITLLLLTALILSLSRGGWIGILVGLSFMAVALLTSRYFERKNFLIALISGLLALALIVLATTPVVERIKTFEQKEEIPNFQSRVIRWGGVVDMIQDHPLIGTGPGTFATIFTRYQPPGSTSRSFYAHNDYLHFISEVGLLFIAIVVWMIIALYRKGFQKMRNPSRLVRGVAVGAMSGITAILIHSISDFNLHIPANALLFVVLSAILVAPLPVNSEQT